jgi:hypothetical protein
LYLVRDARGFTTGRPAAHDTTLWPIASTRQVVPPS